MKFITILTIETEELSGRKRYISHRYTEEELENKWARTPGSILMTDRDLFIAKLKNSLTIPKKK